MGGSATGNCAMGFGVCCRILVDPTCPSDITTASATIVNPGYPNDVNTATATSCSSSSATTRKAAPRIFFPTTTTTTSASSTSVTNVEVSGTDTMYRWAIYKATTTVEQIRIDFVEFDIAPPIVGACTNESMTIMGADAVTNKILPDKLCGCSLDNISTSPSKTSEPTFSQSRSHCPPMELKSGRCLSLKSRGMRQPASPHEDVSSTSRRMPPPSPASTTTPGTGC